jgi:hypothetical protein
MDHFTPFFNLPLLVASDQEGYMNFISHGE